MSRVGSGRVKRFSYLVGRVRSGQEFFKSHGSGWVGSRSDEKFAGRGRSRPAILVLLTRGSDPHIRLADPTLESLPVLFLKGFPRTNTQ